MKVLLVFIVIILSSCEGPRMKRNDLFHVPTEAQKYDTSENRPPPPPPPYYLTHHFIIDSAGAIFYYKLPGKTMSCGTDGEEDDNPIPRYIGLRPDDIIQVPKHAIQEFAKSNIFNEERPRFVMIALLKDTVISFPLKQLIKLLREDGNFWYFFRRATLEETVVIDYEKNDPDSYFPHSMNWDSTKIRSAPLPFSFNPSIYPNVGVWKERKISL
jgi:hypothetical protein